MDLSELATVLEAGNTNHRSPAPRTIVTGITHNASWVKPGNAFVAIRGESADGHSFIDQAIQAGAAVVIGEGLPDDVVCPVPYIAVPHARSALALVAAALENFPSRELNVIGVTGTDGKTTTTWLTAHLHREAGLTTGLLSTIGYELPDGKLQQFPSHFTTPESPQVHHALRRMVSAEAHSVALEASSHALALGRVDAIEFDTAIFTNLSHEHLDFHGTIEQYFHDKAMLFDRARYAVINIDDEWGRQLRGRSAEETTYSIEGGDAQWLAHSIIEHADRITFTVTCPLGTFDAELPMVGRFNVANVLAAMAATAHSGAKLEDLRRGLSTVTGVPGRMQVVSTRSDAPRVVIDFAHTPAALEGLLRTLRTSTQDRLWVLIGAPGRRDATKRGPMGKVTTRLADVVVFTEDDPRDTPVAEIIAEMIDGAEGRINYVAIPDRTDAIRYAISHASENDTVALAGKGREFTIERAHGSDQWDEEHTALAALAARNL